MLKPPQLQPGDTVGLVAPASPVTATDAALELARECLHGLGLITVLGASARRQRGYLAGTDAERAADFNAMFADPAINAVFCLRGGYGSPRLLPRIDYGLVCRHPKVLLGYSDITALHTAIGRHSGVVTFHGPMVTSEFGREWEYNREWLVRATMDPRPLGLLTNPPGGPELETIVPGRVSGPLTGGNLSLLAASLGTPYEVDTAGRILLIEEVGEAPYRVDRMLTQLLLAGKLEAAAGIIIAEWCQCTPLSLDRPTLSLAEVVTDLLSPLGRPVLYGLAAGHGGRALTLPLGVRVSLDAGRRRVVVEESGVTARS